MENKTTVYRLIEYLEQQLRLQGDPQFKETSQETLVDAIRVCKNALSLEKEQIIEAYHIPGSNIRTKEEGEKYYNQRYNINV
jgi:hypothetical protein